MATSPGRVSCCWSRTAPPNQAALVNLSPGQNFLPVSLMRDTFSGGELVAISPGCQSNASDCYGGRCQLSRKLNCLQRVFVLMRRRQNWTAITGSNGKNNDDSLPHAIKWRRCSCCRLWKYFPISARRIDGCADVWPDASGLGGRAVGFQLETTYHNAAAAFVLNISEITWIVTTLAWLIIMLRQSHVSSKGKGVMVLNRIDDWSMVMVVVVVRW